MPQMAPISWLTLFTIFSASLILFCIMNYYSFLPPAPKTSSSVKPQTNSMNWKW